MSNPLKTGAGGTPGGLGSFLLGAVMTLAGGYMFLNQVQVSTGFWGYRFGFGGIGISAFGATMVVFMIGVVLVFFNSKSMIGWIISGGSLLAVFIGIIVNLQVYFARTSLYVTLIMFILLFGGIGLMLRALRNVEAE